MVDFWNDLLQFMNEHGPWVQKVGWGIVKIVILFVLIRIGIKVVTKLTKRALELRTHLDDRRKETLESLSINIIRYVFYFIFLLTILPIFGIEIGGLLAGAGVAGIAIAFAAQSLLKDVLNGFFILFEDQYGVGDFVIINGVWGAIKSVGLRVTTIQVWTGEVVTIPNGEIKQVTNYSKENSFAVIDVNIGYHSDVNRSIEIVEKVMNELAQEQENVVGEVSVLGVQELNDSTYTIRAIAECEPYTHWGTQRLAKQRLRMAFAEEGIDLPVQKIAYVNDEKMPESFRPEQSSRFQPDSSHQDIPGYTHDD